MKLIYKISQAVFSVVAVGFILYLYACVHPPQIGREGRTTVTMWFVASAEEITPPGPKLFNESQEDAFIHLEPIPFLDIEQKFLTSVISGDPPDLFNYFGSVVQWSTRGALMPLDELIERDRLDLNAVYGALWEEMKWNDRIYAIPVGTSLDAFYWNKDHFREAGLDPDRPPHTWKELEEYAKKLTIYNEDGTIKRAGYIPGYWSTFPTPLFLPWAYQKGADFLSDDGKKVNLTSEACIEALEWDGHLFEALGREALMRKRASFGFGPQHGFHSGQVSMILQKSSFIAELDRHAPHLDYGVSMLPAPEDGRPATVTGPLWIGIPSGAAHPEAAWDYIKFLYQAETQIKIAEFNIEHDQVSFFPANIEAATSDVQMSIPGMDVFNESMKYAYPTTVVPLAHTQFWREYGTAWDKVTRGEATAEEALSAAEKVIQKAVNQSLEYNEYYVKYLKEHWESEIKG